MTTTRRSVLKWGLGGAAGLGGVGLLGRAAFAEHTGPDGVEPGAERRPAGVTDRALVVIELQGGNDGLSTFAPFADGRYRDFRPTLALGNDEVVDWGDGWGLTRHLAGLDRTRLAVVHGVGVERPDLSHFEMSDRWAGGTPGGGGSANGFLGRLCDRLVPEDVPPTEVLTGVSVSAAPSPALRSDRAATASLDGPDAFAMFHQGDEAAAQAVRRCLTRLGGSGSDDRLGAARAGIAGVLRLADLLDGLGDTDAPGSDSTDRADDPPSAFAAQLDFATRLLTAEAGVRVIHVPMQGGAFDTHDDHRATHAESMRLLGEGLVRWMGRLDDAGLGDRVLVATTSEFGRRAEEHAGGLDHGAASCALVYGAVAGGAVGEPPSLRKLDDDGNLRSTTPMARYYASLASWLGVDPADVLEGDPTPVDGLLAV